MQNQDYQEFIQIWTAVASLYGNTPQDMAVAIAFRSLQKYELTDIKRALTCHVQNPDGGQFMPKPADLFRHLDGDSQSRPLGAWTTVQTAIGRFGRYESIVLDDAIAMRAIEDMGGWIYLCGMSEAELPFKRDEFTKRYRGYLNTGLSGHPKKLIGVIEAQNSKDFPDAVPEPRLIGNPQKALEVYRSGGKRAQESLSLSQALEQLGENVIPLENRRAAIGRKE